MVVRSFQTKLLFLLLTVLVLLQAATMISVHFAGRRALRNTLTEELRVGRRVFDQILQSRAHQLSDSLRLLALDFAFRDAIASGDAPTIASALENHGQRISADFVVLMSLDGKVTADTLGGRLAGKPFPVPAVLRTAEERGEATATVSFFGRPFQLVIVPVLAPRPIAWVSAGFAYDESVLSNVRRLTSLEVSLWSSAAGTAPNLTSTLTAQQRSDLQARLPRLAGSKESQTTLELAAAAYATLVEPLATADDSKVFVVLQRALQEARRPFVTLEVQIFSFSMVILIAAVIAAIFFARGVTKPLRILAQGAKRIGRGDYVLPIVVDQQDELGQLAHTFNDMQSAIARREDQITYQASHDALTGLPNRALFMDRMTQSIELAKRTGAAVGMIMMDLDRFKEINDTLGHHFGDRLLIEIGRRISQTLRSSDTVARLGGDEFAIKFTTSDISHASEVAYRISGALQAPFVLGDISIDVSASMGIALSPMHAEDAATLMKRADIAMYDAKKNHIAVAMYEPGSDEQNLRRLSLMTELRQAISRDELELYYQPKLQMTSEQTMHCEALVRWKHVKHGLMRPDEFIPLAEQSGNIGLLTKWVLRRAIRQCAEWNRSGHELTVAVNLSALDLFDSELPTFVSGLLADAGLAPTRLVLEITESALMKDPAYALKILRDLKSRGVTLSIDDFGTGYSSLAHLKRLPVDELKIDKSFVLNLSEADSDDLVIVRSTIELGHNMGMIVIAEGVETPEAWQMLKSLGCDLAQGFLMSPPIPTEAFTRWLVGAQWRSGVAAAK